MQFLLLVTLLLVGAWFYPQLSEGSSDPCGALAMRVATLQAQRQPGIGRELALGVAHMAGGTVLGEAMRQRYPATPPQLSCAFFYWKLLLTRDEGPLMAPPR
jgi:hypothetical protein